MILKLKFVFSASVALAMLLFAALAHADMFDTTTQSAPLDFSHIETGFSLTGAHRNAECGSCHAGGVFKGTPRNCSGCHTKGSRVVATPMHPRHVVTLDPCEACHSNTVTFLGARINHGKVLPGSCSNCHNGFMATGKPSNHTGSLQALESCDRCHRTYAWSPSSYNHTGVAPGTCATQCHNGVSATGKPASHTTILKSTSSCDTCHRFFSWLPTFYNHTFIAPGSCSTCHNGVTSTGRPSNHTGAKLTMSCDRCHNTSAWLPAVYNHTGVAPGTCTTCHAAQRPSSHTARGYTASCDVCHSIASNWTFNHALQQGQHTCNSCHAHHNNSTPCDVCHSVSSWGH